MSYLSSCQFLAIAALAARQTKAAKLRQSQIVTIRVRNRGSRSGELHDRHKTCRRTEHINSAAFFDDSSDHEIGDVLFREGGELAGKDGDDQINGDALTGMLAHGHANQGSNRGLQVNRHGSTRTWRREDNFDLDHFKPKKVQA